MDSQPSINIIQDVSQYKQEYLDMELNCLENGEFKDFRLAEFQGWNLLILFYESDFSPIVKEELIVVSEKLHSLLDRNCKVMACSVDSVHVHQAWQNTCASEEVDGLGRKIPFPIIGDKTKRLCRSLGVLDEEKGTAFHTIICLSPNGDLIYKESVDSTISNVHNLADKLLEVADAAKVMPVNQNYDESIPKDLSPKLGKLDTLDGIARRISDTIKEEDEDDENDEEVNKQESKIETAQSTAPPTTVPEKTSEPSKPSEGSEIRQQNQTPAASTKAPSKPATTAEQAKPAEVPKSQQPAVQVRTATGTQENSITPSTNPNPTTPKPNPTTQQRQQTPQQQANLTKKKKKDGSCCSIS